jgi:hypothetical protein
LALPLAPPRFYPQEEYPVRHDRGAYLDRRKNVRTDGVLTASFPGKAARRASKDWLAALQTSHSEMPNMNLKS